MATIQGYTKERMDEIIDTTVDGAHVDGFGHLVLDQVGGGEVDVGAFPAPSASETVEGLVELATDAETLTGTDTDRAITPANLTAKLAAVVVAASTTVAGIVELATSAETITGSDTVRAVTPAGLAAKVASTTAQGIVELATSAETITGSDTDRAVTPAGLATKVASATAQGIVELATDAETETGTDTTRAITPANLASIRDNIQQDSEVTSGNTGSTSYTATLSAGNTPQLVFVAPPSGKALALISGYLVNSTSTSFTYMGFEVREGGTPGAGTLFLSADDTRALINRDNSAGTGDQSGGLSYLIEGLTPGATYNIQGMYRVSANTGTYPWRRIIIDTR